jgi:hypothetical protein
MINCKVKSGLHIVERERKDIIIGAPHHAIGGVISLPCPEHKVSDENTGLIAQKIANELNLSLLVGCNAQIDYNKSELNEYYQKLKDWNPLLLIEIHGHGGVKVNERTIEISSGSKTREILSIDFAESLNRELKIRKTLSEFKANGNFDEIFFKAKNTKTINNDNWKGIHIEIPKPLRVENNMLPLIANDLIECLIISIKNIHKKILNLNY